MNFQTISFLFSPLPKSFFVELRRAARGQNRLFIVKYRLVINFNNAVVINNDVKFYAWATSLKLAPRIRTSKRKGMFNMWCERNRHVCFLNASFLSSFHQNMILDAWYVKIKESQWRRFLRETFYVHGNILYDFGVNVNSKIRKQVVVSN